MLKNFSKKQSKVQLTTNVQKRVELYSALLFFKEELKMQVRLSDNDQEYIYKKVNFIKIDGQDFIINYQDENDEECEEIGPIPGDLTTEDDSVLLNKLRILIVKAAEDIYGDAGFKNKGLVTFNSIHRYAHIDSIDDLLEYDADEIPNIRNIGAIGFEIIMKARCIAKEDK